MTLALDSLTLERAALIMREAVKDKSYRAFPMGQEAGYYLRAKRKALAASSYRDYESGLDKLARHFCDLEMPDFEPPIGTERLEEFLDAQWGTQAPRTYNKNLSIMRSFFKWAVLRGKLHGDPTLAIENARARQVHREVFSDDHRRAILAASPELVDRIALRLLIDYGLRKGALQAVEFRHFDHQRRRLTVFTKGEKVREVPIPQPSFWLDLERLIQNREAEPHHHLMHRTKQVWRGYNDDGSSRFDIIHYPEKARGAHALHDWWYGCLERAGIVAKGTTRGERMHKARHTAGQRVLDKTGNLKAVQKLLGHDSIQTTADIYLDWDIDALTETMKEVIGDE